MALTWTCHVCGEDRPDERISVHHRDEKLAGQTVATNIRYCNDRSACIEGVQTFSFFGSH